MEVDVLFHASCNTDYCNISEELDSARYVVIRTTKAESNFEIHAKETPKDQRPKKNFGDPLDKSVHLQHSELSKLVSKRKRHADKVSSIHDLIALDSSVHPEASVLKTVLKVSLPQEADVVHRVVHHDMHISTC